ncbi:hypothetical protein BOTBODRAFT_550011 [Botryobasidium botryosum FD-172 SS1]|uniref:Uncharacterized protein n=1 Tax=Botryobasidium botryosum (strain FD-172 SS1) TaxID=930990 RepID=A0A067MTR9_BOTB1|nr:hypothetical protein BOTBODRAFT_550011 [Botryobasidium botryosum FD-172 SS1]
MESRPSASRVFCLRLHAQGDILLGATSRSISFLPAFSACEPPLSYHLQFYPPSLSTLLASADYFLSDRPKRLAARSGTSSNDLPHGILRPTTLRAVDARTNSHRLNQKTHLYGRGDLLFVFWHPILYSICGLEFRTNSALIVCSTAIEQRSRIARGLERYSDEF